MNSSSFKYKFHWFPALCLYLPYLKQTNPSFFLSNLLLVPLLITVQYFWLFPALDLLYIEFVLCVCFSFYFFAINSSDCLSPCSSQRLADMLTLQSVHQLSQSFCWIMPFSISHKKYNWLVGLTLNKGKGLVWTHIRVCSPVCRCKHQNFTKLAIS